MVKYNCIYIKVAFIGISDKLSGDCGILLVSTEVEFNGHAGVFAHAE